MLETARHPDATCEISSLFGPQTNYLLPLHPGGQKGGFRDHAPSQLPRGWVVSLYGGRLLETRRPYLQCVIQVIWQGWRLRENASTGFLRHHSRPSAKLVFYRTASEQASKTVCDHNRAEMATAKSYRRWHHLVRRTYVGRPT